MYVENFHNKKKITSKWCSSQRADLYVVLIIIAFSYNSILVYASAIFARLPFVSLFGYSILPIVTSMIAVLCIARKCFKYIRVCDLFSVFCIVLALILSYLLYPNSREFFNQRNMRLIYLEVIPYFLLGLNFRCENKVMKYLTVLSYVAIIINSMYMFLLVGATSREGDYYMGQAYMLLPHVLFSINSMFNKSIVSKKIVPFCFSILGFLFLFAMGTRGPLLIAVIYMMVKVFLSLDKKKVRTILTIAVVVSAFIIFVSSGAYENVLIWLSDFLSSLGMSTRIIDSLILHNYITYTSGRDIIYETLWQKLLERPLLGYGIFGEWQFTGYSAHNIYLQVCFHYGFLIGICLLVWYLFTTIKAYIFSSGVIKDLILIFLIFTVVRGFFGGEYFSYYVFFLLGLSIQQLRKKNLVVMDMGRLL